MRKTYSLACAAALALALSGSALASDTALQTQSVGTPQEDFQAILGNSTDSATDSVTIFNTGIDFSVLPKEQEAEAGGLSIYGSDSASDPSMGVSGAQSRAQELASKMVDFEYRDILTARVPAGWNYSAGGYDLYHWIRFYDPQEPSLQVFLLLKAEPLLKSDAAKEYYQTWGKYDFANVMKNAVVNSSGSVAEFFYDFMEYCAYCASTELTYAGFEFPQITNFQVLDSWKVNDFYAGVADDDKLLYATFTDALTQGQAEGMFTGALVNSLSIPAMGIDTGAYSVYNVSGVSAPLGTFGEYAQLLSTILGSISYTDTFIKTVGTDLITNLNNAYTINSITQETSAIVLEGWYQRQQTYDDLSQKYSEMTRSA